MSLFYFFLSFSYSSIKSNYKVQLLSFLTTNKTSGFMTEAEVEVGIPFKRSKPPSILLLTVARLYFCCGSLQLLVLAVRIYTLIYLLC